MNEDSCLRASGPRVWQSLSKIFLPLHLVHTFSEEIKEALVTSTKCVFSANPGCSISILLNGQRFRVHVWMGTNAGNIRIRGNDLEYSMSFLPGLDVISNHGMKPLFWMSSLVEG